MEGFTRSFINFYNEIYKRNNDFELCNTSHFGSGNIYPQIVPNKDRDLVLEYIKDNHESIPRKASYVHMYITSMVI